MSKAAESKIITVLKQKVKELERQICDRTRNFLVHKGMKNLNIVSKAESEAQTDDSYYHMQSNLFQTASKSSIMMDSPQTFTQDPYQAKYDEVLNRRLDISEFDANQTCQQTLTDKMRLCKILQKLIEEQRRMDIDREDLDSVAESTHSQQSPDHNYKLDKEYRRMKKEIKKLKASLEFERKVSSYAKEGLIISEQENYQFRLKIKQLVKQSSQQIEQTLNSSLHEAHQQSNQQRLDFEKVLKAKDELILAYQAEVVHQKEMKQEYLDSCLMANAESDELKKTIQQLHEEIALLKHQNASKDSHELIVECPAEQRQVMERQRSQYRTSQKFIEALKDTSYSISNCIPITEEHQHTNLFKPESEEQIIEALKRVEDYCKDIQKWQKIRLQSIASEKKMFLNFIKKISQKIDSSTKQHLTNQLNKINEMKHYLKIFSNEEESFEKNHIKKIVQTVQKTQQIKHDEL